MGEVNAPAGSLSMLSISLDGCLFNEEGSQSPALNQKPVAAMRDHRALFASCRYEVASICWSSRVENFSLWCKVLDDHLTLVGVGKPLHKY